MPDFYSNRLADNIRVAKSRTLLSPEAGTYNLIKIPKNALVKRVWLMVVEAGSSDTISIGFSGNGETAQAAGFISTTYAEATAVGMKDSITSSTSTSAKYFNNGSGAITLTVGTTQTSGEFIVFTEYSVVY